MVDHLTLSRHAERRLAQRDLSCEDVEYVMTFGDCTHRAGAAAFFLGWRHHPTHDARRRYSHLEGTIVLVCPHCECVLTAYRNRRGLKKHEHKTKYDRRHGSCPRCGA